VSTPAYPSRVRPYWWLGLAGVAVGLIGGGVAVAVSPVAYSSSAAVLVTPVPTLSLAGQLVAGEINLETEAEVARSSHTAVEAATSLPGEPAPEDVVRAVTVDTLANTSVLVMQFEAATPGAARAGAQAIAQAYLANRTALATRTVSEQTTAITAKLKETTAALTTMDARIADLPDGSPQLATLRANRQTLTQQIGILTARSTDLATTTVTAGRIIRDADLPTVPVRPSVPLLLAIGAAAGGALGIVGAAGRARLSRRVRGADDVARHAELPLLAEFSGDLPGMRRLAPRVFAPQYPAGRAFHRLRNEVAAAMAADDQVILVTGVSPGRASTVVAANLAAALARADNEVILVGANVPGLRADGLLLSDVFDIADVPGLTDVLTRRAPLTTALQRAPRAPRLRVIPPGGTASAAGLLQSEAVRATLDALRGQARYVVVEAPSAASGADAQSLSGLADVAIVVVETGQARHADVADAARQLRLVGTRILGAVLLPPLTANDDDVDEFPAAQHRAGEPPLKATDTWINPATMNAPTALQPMVPPADASTTSTSSENSASTVEPSRD